MVRIFVAEALVEMLADIPQFLAAGIEELEGIDLDDHMEVRHLVCGKTFPDDLVHEKDFGLGMVNQVMDVAGLELVEDRDRNGAIGHGRQETDAPVGLVTGANGNLVALL